MRKNKKPVIYEFDPVIYPRKLWVGIGVDPNFYNEHFGGLNGEKLDFSDVRLSYAVTFNRGIERKETGKYGILVIFQNKDAMRMGNIAHEASHVVDGIENSIGMTHGDEPSAYLLGFVCRCINIARLGACEPLIFESEEIENSKK